MKKKSPAPVILVFYPTPEDWASVKSFADDPERLGDSHADWLNSLDEAEERIWAAGAQTVRVPVRADNLKSYCDAKKVKCDGDLRSRFANAVFAVARKRALEKLP